jgi:nicotinate-nucleotide pyrophosphorylase (carboxylating)
VKAVAFEPLDPSAYRELVRRALAEDFGWGDITTEGTIDPDQKAHAIILAKSRCVIAGLDIASETFRQLDPGVAVTERHRDGELCDAGTIVAEYSGSPASRR